MAAIVINKSNKELTDTGSKLMQNFGISEENTGSDNQNILDKNVGCDNGGIMETRAVHISKAALLEEKITGSLPVCSDCHDDCDTHERVAVKEVQDQIMEGEKVSSDQTESSDAETAHKNTELDPKIIQNLLEEIRNYTPSQYRRYLEETVEGIAPDIDTSSNVNDNSRDRGRGSQNDPDFQLLDISDPNIGAEETRRRLAEDLDLRNFLDLHDVLSETRQPEVPTYTFPLGDARFTQCKICLEWINMHVRICCGFPACRDCLMQYCTVQVQQAVVEIKCPGDACDKYVHRDEILFSLQGDMKDKFYKFLADANKVPHEKTCPRCSHVLSIDPAELTRIKHKKKGLKVVCPQCFLVWCFPCHAPWHEGVSCKDFIKGDKLLKKWAKELHMGQANAQRCPNCKVFIQRTMGCDHMECSRCSTQFCYRCGERYLALKFIGDHYSKHSVFGCKYRFLPDKPVQRKFIRGAILGGKLMVAPILGGLAVAAGATLLCVGVVALPIYGGIKARKLLKERRLREERRRDHRKRLEAVRKAGDPYLEYIHHMQQLGFNPYYLLHRNCDDPSRNPHRAGSSEARADNDISSEPSSFISLEDLVTTTEAENPFYCGVVDLRLKQSDDDDDDDTTSTESFDSYGEQDRVNHITVMPEEFKVDGLLRSATTHNPPASADECHRGFWAMLNNCNEASRMELCNWPYIDDSDSESISTDDTKCDLDLVCDRSEKYVHVNQKDEDTYL